MGDIDVVVKSHVAEITVDSPETRNALTPEMGRDLAAACDEIDADMSIGAAVIKGAGGTFCSGGDTRGWDPQADQALDENYRRNSAVYSAFVRVGALKVPTVAAVRGAAVGAGLNLLLAADLRIVARDARLLAGFVRIGLHPGGGYFTLSGRLAGREVTAAMGLFSEELSGSDAVDRGLAWEALADEEVEARAFDLAASAAADPALAREALRSFRTELGPPQLAWEAALEFERGVQMWSLRRRGTGQNGGAA